MKTTKLKRDKVISVVRGKDLVGLYLKNEPDKLLLECSPEKADALIEIWNDKGFHAKTTKNDLRDLLKNEKGNSLLQKEIKKEMKAIEKEDVEILDPDIDISELNSEEAFNRGYYRGIESILNVLNDK